MKRSYDSCRYGFKICFLNYNYVANLQGSDMAMILVHFNIGQIKFWWRVLVHLLDILAWYLLPNTSSTRTCCSYWRIFCSVWRINYTTYFYHLKDNLPLLLKSRYHLWSMAWQILTLLFFIPNLSCHNQSICPFILYPRDILNLHIVLVVSLVWS